MYNVKVEELYASWYPQDDVSLVQSYFNYCATDWGAAYFSNIKPIYVIQKKILNIFDLCKHNILEFFYRVVHVHSESFQYFEWLFSEEQVDYMYNLRSDNIRAPYAPTKYITISFHHTIKFFINVIIYWCIF